MFWAKNKPVCDATTDFGVSPPVIVWIRCNRSVSEGPVAGFGGAGTSGVAVGLGAGEFPGVGVDSTAGEATPEP
jgi:hypothetical protein